MIHASDGQLYGTAFEGGSDNRGTVFRLNKDGSHYMVLHSFSNIGRDGDGLRSALMEGPDGALYGTTQGGGGSASGTVFKLNKDGTGYSVLHRFTGGDGAQPYAGLVRGDDDTILGTTRVGGTSDRGTVFKLKTDGSGYTVLNRFSPAGNDCGQPYAGLVRGLDGAFYGAAYDGGASDRGGIFKINPDGTGYTVFHSFSSNELDGRRPHAGLTLGSDGTFYGVTESGGANGAGTVFRLQPACSWSFGPSKQSLYNRIKEHYEKDTANSHRESRPQRFG